MSYFPVLTCVDSTLYRIWLVPRLIESSDYKRF